MRNIAIIAALLCSGTSAFALTPFDLDYSRIKTCKVKYGHKGEHTLLTSVVALDNDGKVVTEFGDKNGKPFENFDDSKTGKEFLIKSGICSEIKHY